MVKSILNTTQYKNNKYKVILLFSKIILISFLNLLYATNYVIKIHATSQSFNISTNTMTFETNVVLTYKHYKLCANKIIINYDPHLHHNISTIKAIGDPAILTKTSQSSEPVSIQALVMYYNSSDKTITFNGDVHVKQSGNYIKSANIIYSIPQQKIHAFSNNHEKTITTLLIK